MIAPTVNLMALLGEQIVTVQGRGRFWFGLTAALIIVLILVAHLEGSVVKLDTVALGLLAAVLACLLLALSERLGIKEIAAGFTVEFAEQALERIVADHRGQYSQVLNNNQDLWPATGARVLWVDDHHEQLIPHRQVLRRLGFQVVIVTSTDEAIAELERDSDFVLMIQDNRRRGTHADAKTLVDCIKDRKYEPQVPLVVYSYDSFNPSVGVESKDWIKQDFSLLLERVAKEVRAWPKRFPTAQGKSPK